MKKKIMTMAMMALAFTACTKEDLMPPTQGDAGTLHITSVTIDGQQVARTRMVADDGEYIMSELPYNQSFNGFAAGDWLKLDIYNLYAEDTYNSDFKATYGNEGWSIGGHLRPIKGMTWADVGLKAGISVDRIMGGTEKYSTHADNMGVVQGDIDESNSYIYGDWLTAETNNGTSLMPIEETLTVIFNRTASMNEDTAISNFTVNLDRNNGDILIYVPIVYGGDARRIWRSRVGVR